MLHLLFRMLQYIIFDRGLLLTFFTFSCINFVHISQYFFVFIFYILINQFIKKQSQRFALQELLKQFLAASYYITAISYQPKKQSQRFAMISHYITAISYFINKERLNQHCRNRRFFCLFFLSSKTQAFWLF